MSHSSRPLSTSALAALLAGLTLVASGCGDDSSDSGKSNAEPAKIAAGDPAVVVKAIDGDTLDVKMDDGQKVRVRLLGIDAPESTTKRNGHVECGGKLAAGAMRQLSTRSPKVLIATDPTQDAKDKFGRTLAYVSPATGDGTTWQQQLLTAGWATIYEQSGAPVQLDQEFRAAAAVAKKSGAGVWQICDGDFHQAE